MLLGSTGLNQGYDKYIIEIKKAGLLFLSVGLESVINPCSFFLIYLNIRVEQVKLGLEQILINKNIKIAIILFNL